MPFWTEKTLAEMTPAEWESLCDGCGRCCLHKLEDEDTGEIGWTNVACHLLDGATCRCRRYETRRRYIPDCVKLDATTLDSIGWLPPTCAYRRLRDGEGLAWWHPLVSGDPSTVHSAGISVRGRTVSERDAPDLEQHLVEWPGRVPRTRRGRD